MSHGVMVAMTDADYDELLGRPTRSRAQKDYLGVLTDLVETYEHAHVAIPPTSRG